MTFSLDQLFSDGPQWHDEAACGEAGASEVFLHTLSGSRTFVPAAIAICRRCPVRGECSEHARATDQRSGVWGGVDRGR